MSTSQIVLLGGAAGFAGYAIYRYYVELRTAPPVLPPGAVFGPPVPEPDATTVAPGPIVDPDLPQVDGLQ